MTDSLDAAQALRARRDRIRGGVVGFVLGLPIVAHALGLSEVDDRYLLTAAIACLAIVAGFGFWVVGYFRRASRNGTAVAASIGFVLGLATLWPLDLLRVESVLDRHKGIAEDLCASLRSWAAAGGSLPTRDELAASPEWTTRLDSHRGDFIYRPGSDGRFEILVRDPFDKPYGHGVHHLDSETGEWTLAADEVFIIECFR